MQTKQKPEFVGSLPVVSFKFYKAITNILGRYPESTLLNLSKIIGRPNSPRKARRLWNDFEEFRTNASICDYTGIALWKLLTKLNPTSVLEFGTGFSTLIMIEWARQFNPMLRIISFEHDKYWYDTQIQVIEKLSLKKYVTLVEAPITKQIYFDRCILSYSLVEEALNNIGIVPDLFLIDGPPSELYGGPSRAGVMIQTIALAKPGSTILVHDALRKEEFSYLDEFNENPVFQFNCKGIIPLWYGLAVCMKKF